MTLDIELARRNMVQSQVRTWDVLNFEVLETLNQVRREDFVPEAFRNMAFTDMAIPLGHGECMMKPVVEGRILQALELTKADHVLEIGTGSGYFAACMAHLASSVESVDIHEDFIRTASDNLKKAHIDNVLTGVAEAVNEFIPKREVDVLVVTGALAEIPQRFLSWLKPHGRALFILGESPVMHAVLVHREGQNNYRQQSLFETDLPWLVHAEPELPFVL